MSKKEKIITRYSQSVEHDGIVMKLKTLVTVQQDSYELLPFSEIIFSSEAFDFESAVSPSEIEESIFEFLRDLSEAFPEFNATIIIKSFSSHDCEEYEIMRSRIRAIFRAAVYGSISLICEGAQTLSEFDSFCDIISKIFCELETEGREFNGYIPRGVLIRTPLSALCLGSCSADLFCLDLDNMIPLITGNENNSIDILTDSTVVAVSNILSDIFKDTRKTVSILSSSLSPCICKLAEACGAKEIWIKKQKSTNL